MMDRKKTENHFVLMLRYLIMSIILSDHLHKNGTILLQCEGAVLGFSPCCSGAGLTSSLEPCCMSSSSLFSAVLSVRVKNIFVDLITP